MVAVRQCRRGRAQHGRAFARSELDPSVRGFRGRRPRREIAGKGREGRTGEQVEFAFGDRDGGFLRYGRDQRVSSPRNVDFPQLARLGFGHLSRLTQDIVRRRPIDIGEQPDDDRAKYQDCGESLAEGGGAKRLSQERGHSTLRPLRYG